MKTEILLKRSVVAVALTLASTHVVMAQDGAKPIQKVMVTGSNIRHVDAETASPVQVIKREDIERSGANSVRELLDTLTSADNTLSDLSGSNSFASGGTAASLRGLGKQSTLVLLNSRRVAPYALADYNEVFTNLDTLPISAVERVEVLKNGGSAIYGSDAVAGVINIITRADFNGVVGRASHYQSTQTSAFNTSTASLTGGWGNLATDRYNVMANVEVFQRNEVNWRQVVDGINPAYGKKFSAVAEGSGLMFGNRGAPSTFSYPGNLIGQGSLPGCTTLNSAKQCVHDRFSRFEVQPSADRVNALVAATFDLGNGLGSYSELLYSHTKTEYMSAFNTYGSTNGDTVWGDPRTGEGKAFISRMLPATHPLNTSGKPLELRYRFSDSPAERMAESDQYRLLTGLKGNYKGYEWDSAVGITGGKTKQRSRGSFSDSGFKKVIGDYTLANDPQFFNRDYKLGQPNSEATLATLFPTYGYDGKVTQYFIDGKISGDLTTLNGRPVGIAAGGDLRHEAFSISPTQALRDGDIVGNGASIADANRNAASAFTEINIPLASKLELIGAARVDKFGSFDAHVSPKVALRWEVAPQLLLRGTFETGFRAPNLTESAPSTKFAFSSGVVDPKRCDQAQALANDLRAAAKGMPATDPNKALNLARADIVEVAECRVGVASIVRHNPDLKPETSQIKSAGFVLEPIKGTSITVDYWHIVRKDEIGTKDNDQLLEAEDTLAAGIVNRQQLSSDKTFSAEERAKYGVTVGPLASISGQFENVAKTRTHGVDVAFKSSVNTPVGKLNLDGNSTYLLNYQVFAPTLNGGSYGDNLAGRYGTPKLIANLGAALTTGNFTNSLRAYFEKGTSLNYDYYDNSYTVKGCAARGWSADECRVADYHRLDYNLKWKGIKDLTLSLYVRNIQNTRPPVNLRRFNATGGAVIPQSSDDVKRRMVRVTAEYAFK